MEFANTVDAGESRRRRRENDRQLGASCVAKMYRSQEIPRDEDFRNLVRIVSTCTRGLWALCITALCIRRNCSSSTAVCKKNSRKAS